MVWWVPLLRKSTKEEERSLESSQMPSSRLSVQVCIGEWFCRSSRSRRVPASAAPFSHSTGSWILDTVWLLTFCNTSSPPIWLLTIELPDVDNKKVFGEEIVVKDMHTRKALMSKLVSVNMYSWRRPWNDHNCHFSHSNWPSHIVSRAVSSLCQVVMEPWKNCLKSSPGRNWASMTNR